MSVATIDAGSYQSTSLFANYRQRTQGMRKPASDCSAGAADTRQTFSAIQQAVERTAASPAGIDFSALNNALDAGDLAGAKRALAAIQQERPVAQPSDSATAASASSGTFRITA